MRKAGIAAGWAWAAALVWLSLTPSPLEVDIQHGDKVGHFVAYGWLMFWFAQLYTQRWARVAHALTFIALGVGLEYVQGELSYRTYDVFDMYANALGVLLGWAGALVLPRMRIS